MSNVDPPSFSSSPFEPPPGRRGPSGFGGQFGPGEPFGFGGPFGPGGPFQRGAFRMGVGGHHGEHEPGRRMRGPRGDRWRGGFPFGGPMGGPFAGRARTRRGDVRAAILQLLAERPMHGYQIIQELTERSDGRWNPSPGSIYPTLQQLQDEGLVRSDEEDGRRVFHLTDAGRAVVQETTSGRGAPWEDVGEGPDGELLQLRDVAMQVGAAVLQVAHAGNAAQVARATQMLTELRRSLYRLLADDEPPTDAPGESATPPGASEPGA